MDNKFIRACEPDDPQRCQSGGAKGQCPYRAVEGAQYCPRHGGNKVQEVARAKVRSQYDLAMWRASIEHFSEHDSIKSLRDETGIMRMLLQTTLEKCKSQNDLMLWQPKISELVNDIRTLVTSMHRLDTSLGVMLDKTAALNLAMTMVEIVAEEVVDDGIADRIGKRFAQLVANSGTQNA